MEKLPELPRGEGREEMSAWPGLGKRDYTADQMLAYGALCARMAREEAARICEAEARDLNGLGADEAARAVLVCVRAIRGG